MIRNKFVALGVLFLFLFNFSFGILTTNAYGLSGRIYQSEQSGNGYGGKIGVSFSRGGWRTEVSINRGWSITYTYSSNTDDDMLNTCNYAHAGIRDGMNYFRITGFDEDDNGNRINEESINFSQELHFSRPTVRYEGGNIIFEDPDGLFSYSYVVLPSWRLPNWDKLHENHFEDSSYSKTSVSIPVNVPNGYKLYGVAKDRWGVLSADIPCENSPQYNNYYSANIYVDKDAPGLVYKAGSLLNGKKEREKIISGISASDPSGVRSMKYRIGENGNFVLLDVGLISLDKEEYNGKNLYIRVEDNLGNNRIVGIGEIKDIDRTKPILSVFGTLDSIYSSNKIIKAESNESGSKLFYDIGNGWKEFNGTLNIDNESYNGKILKIKATDEAGNEDIKILGTIQNIDSKKPVVEIVKNINNNFEKEKVISFRIADDNIETITLNGEPYTSLSEKVLTESDNGKTFELIATDKAGNITKISVGPVENIDSTPPSLTIVNDFNSDIRNSKTLTFKVDEESTYQWYVEGETNKVQITEEEITIDEEKYNGKKLVVIATDRAGNSKSVKTNIITGIDNTNPVINITNPNKEIEKSKKITATDEDLNKDNFRYSINKDGSCDINQKFNEYEEITFDSEEDNGKFVCYQSIDKARNETYKVSEKIEGIDTTKPEITITQDFSEEFSKNKILKATIVDSNIEKAFWNFEGETEKFEFNGEIEINSEDDNGKKIEITAIDKAGNETKITSKEIKGIDNKTPTITVIKDFDNGFDKEKTIELNANDENGLESFKAFLGNEEIGDIVDGKLTLNDEKYNGKTISIIAKDKAGNETKIERTISGIDTTLPVTNVEYETSFKGKIRKINVHIEDENSKSLKWTTVNSNETCDNVNYGNSVEINSNPFDYTIEFFDESDNGKTLCLEIEDKAGNKVKNQKTIEGIDNTPPIVNEGSITQTGFLDYSLKGELGELEDGMKIQIKEGDTIIKEAIINSKEIDETFIVTEKPGEREFVAYVFDQAGNVNEVSRIKVFYGDYVSSVKTTFDKKGFIYPNSKFFVQGFVKGDNIKVLYGNKDLCGEIKIENGVFYSGECNNDTIGEFKMNFIVDGKRDSLEKKGNIKKINKGVSGGYVFQVKKDERVRIISEKPKENLEEKIEIVKKEDNIEIVKNEEKTEKEDSIVKEEGRTYFEFDGGIYSIKDHSCGMYDDVGDGIIVNYFSDTKDPIINKFREAGIVNGVGENRFEPNRGIDRAEFLAVLIRGNCIKDHGGTDIPFNDVDRNHWHYSIIKTAYHEGIINGYNDGTFRPKQDISRIEALAVLLRVNDLRVEKYPENFEEHSYEDIDKTWNEIMNKAKYLKLVNGISKEFQPDKEMLRKDVLKVLYKLYGKYK